MTATIQFVAVPTTAATLRKNTAKELFSALVACLSSVNVTFVIFRLFTLHLVREEEKTM